MRLKPCATNASRILNDVGSSAVQPKTFPPSAKGATSNPDFPSFLFFTMLSSPPRTDVQPVPGRADDDLVDAHVRRLLRHPADGFAQVGRLQHLCALFRRRR